nr:hypothetical protein [Deinobacterium chartae]
MSLSGAAFAQPGGYYPSTPGKVWRYSSGEVQAFVGFKTIRNTRVMTLQHTVNGKLVSEDYLEFASNGVYLRGSTTNGKLTWYDRPLMVYPAAPLAPGTSWSSAARSGKDTVQLSARVVGQEGLELAAGRFNALVIRTEVQTASGGSSVVHSYFVPGVGTVRFVTEDGAAIDLLK